MLRCVTLTAACAFIGSAALADGEMLSMEVNPGSTALLMLDVPGVPGLQPLELVDTDGAGLIETKLPMFAGSYGRVEKGNSVLMWCNGQRAQPLPPGGVEVPVMFVDDGPPLVVSCDLDALLQSGAAFVPGQVFEVVEGQIDGIAFIFVRDGSEISGINDLTPDFIADQPAYTGPAVYLDAVRILAADPVCRLDQPCPPDVNDDGVVDSGDLFDFLSAWSDGDPGDPVADYNCDGVVDSDDLFEFLSDWSDPGQFPGC